MLRFLPRRAALIGTRHAVPRDALRHGCSVSGVKALVWYLYSGSSARQAGRNTRAERAVCSCVRTSAQNAWRYTVSVAVLRDIDFSPSLYRYGSSVRGYFTARAGARRAWRGEQCAMSQRHGARVRTNSGACTAQVEARASVLAEANAMPKRCLIPKRRGSRCRRVRQMRVMSFERWRVARS